MATGKALPTLIGMAMALVLVSGCGSSGSADGGAKQASGKAYAPSIDPAGFTTRIDNKYFPLEPGTTFVYKGETADATEGDTVRVTSHTKKVMGVECVVVEDRVTEDGELTEKTYDWYAQDERGNVWYFGEDSREYENGKVKSTGARGRLERMVPNLASSCRLTPRSERPIVRSTTRARPKTWPRR
jgi:hypothetical protein